MNKQSRQTLRWFYGITDFIISCLSYLLSTKLWLSFQKTRGSNPAEEWIYLLLFSGSFVLAQMLLGQYESRRWTSRFTFPFRTLAASGATVLLETLLLFLSRVVHFSRGVLFLSAVLNALLIALKDLLLRVTLGNWLKKISRRSIVIAGNGPLAQRFHEDLKASNTLSYRVCGFFGEEDSACQPYLGGFDAMDDYLSQNAVDEVIIALGETELSLAVPLIACCEKNGIRVSVIPFYNEIIPAHPTLEIIGSSKLISLRSNPLDHIGKAFIKRLFDTVVSALLLLLLSPLFLLVAIGVKCSGPGPIFFKQTRVGRYKKPFEMYKFRSMVSNAKENSGWSTNADPRRTRFGSFIRRFSIDELPQLINVLKGEMSLIGPRPEIPYYVEKFKEGIPLYMVKHQVRPGMTGWAQVNGLRGDTSIAKRIELDIWYIENWSFTLDFEILLKTLFGGFVNQEVLNKKKNS